MNYWMVAIAPENWDATRRTGVTAQGFTTKQRRKVERMEPGDRLLFYLKDKRVFAATATVRSKMYEERARIWTGSTPNEVFPHRVQITSDAVMPPGRELDAGLIAPRMEYLKRWPMEMWPMGLQGELHILPRKDLELIEGEMLRILRPGYLPPLTDEARPRRQYRRPRPQAAPAPDGSGTRPNPVS
ncbi:MAG: EVE domain-containing protein [SAR202 cluster bacterium]|nr:EVE domain-containing protein [SAR202 cluster bacterium]